MWRQVRGVAVIQARESDSKDKGGDGGNSGGSGLV